MAATISVEQIFRQATGFIFMLKPGDIAHVLCCFKTMRYHTQGPMPRESRFWNLGNFCLWNQEYSSSIRNPSSTDKECGIQYLESGIHVVESRIQNPQCGIHNPESTAWNPESRIHGKESRIQNCLWFLYIVWHINWNYLDHTLLHCDY